MSLGSNPIKVIAAQKGIFATMVQKLGNASMDCRGNIKTANTKIHAQETIKENNEAAIAESEHMASQLRLIMERHAIHVPETVKEPVVPEEVTEEEANGPNGPEGDPACDPKPTE